MITCHFEDGHPAQLRHMCADIIATRNDQVLLVRRADHLVEGGKWAVPGGYMDRDETITQTAVRELMEETGYETSGVRLFCVDSRPERPSGGRQNVTMVFLAEAKERSGTPDHESTEITWFSFDEVRTLAAQGRVAFWHEQYIAAYETYLAAPFALPLLDAFSATGS